jgi:hypothetical protein
MKKMLLAALAFGLVAAGSLTAGFFGRGRFSGPNNCATPACAPCAPVCAPVCAPCAPAVCQTAIPKCFKTIEVPAIERRIPNSPIRRCVKNPDRVEYIEQAPLVIPQEPLKKCTPVADTVWFEEVPDTIVYECPVDAQAAPCAPMCGTRCR